MIPIRMCMLNLTNCRSPDSTERSGRTAVRVRTIWQPPKFGHRTCETVSQIIHVGLVLVMTQ
jgi:hypothetical protein